MALRLARSRLLTHCLRGKIEALTTVDGVPLPVLTPILVPSPPVDGNDIRRGGFVSNTRNFCSAPRAGTIEVDEIVTIDDKGSTSQVQIKLLIQF